ncbi:interleukin-1 receptor-associated kinase 1-binding protein 1-like [Antedon mediterranea]|uniref:interleukin-1 receptor-associated kinase 1-binding protein 1-like n=1 Tax=Antedon mediterranea TaxID=105859 RepID=UPI003AF86C99
MSYKPSRVYASLLDQSNTPTNNKNQGNPRPKTSTEIEVTATAEARQVPNRANVTVVVSSRKEVAAEAKNSVARRTDYIFQALHTFQVKEGDVSRTDSLQREDGLYVMTTELLVTFVDIEKCLAVTNLLVEKLDDSVIITQPEFHHTPHSVEELRKQVLIKAVSNCRQKADNIGLLLGQVVGQPNKIIEEYTKEWEGPETAPTTERLGKSLTMQQRIANATVHVKAKVKINFEMMAKEKAKATTR